MDEKTTAAAQAILLEIMKAQEAKSPELKEKQLRLLEALASKQSGEAKPDDADESPSPTIE